MTTGRNLTEQAASAQYSDAIRAVYDSALDPSLWPQALDVIANVLNGIGCVILIGREDGTFDTVHSDALDSMVKAYLAEGWWRQDIRTQRWLARHYHLNSDFYTDRDLVTTEEVERHPYYADFLAFHGLRWCIGGSISPYPGMVVALTIQRSPDHPAFSDEEIKLFAAIARHAETALKLTVQLKQRELSGLSLADALARLGKAVFVVDGSGLVLQSNRAAADLPDEVIGVDRHRLRAASVDVQRELDAAIRTVAEQADYVAVHPAVVRLGSGTAGPLIASILPVTDASTAPLARAFTSARALVLVDTLSAAAPDAAVLRDTLGLTLGEARVAAQISLGRKPQEAAAELGIAEETARSVLKRVFSKTGVSSQSELTALVLRTYVD